MANEEEILNRLSGPITNEYNQASSYPVTLTGIGLNVVNTDSSNALTVTVTHGDDTTTAITIPANTGWSDFLKSFKSFTKSGSSTAFLIQVRKIRVEQ